jgi:6-phosphofructokinase
MRIGILTGGGDVPGLNPCIKTVVYSAIDEGMEVLGIRRGWAGLLEFNPDDPNSCEHCTIPLNKQNTRTIDRSGGTFLHTSRTNPSRVIREEAPDFMRPPVAEGTEGDEGPFDFTPHVLRVIEKLGLDVLIPIGGDDTLSYAERMYREGVHIVAIPKTMDNDVFGTDYCIGFSTAVTRSVEFIHQLRTSAGSHERIAIIELFGRNCGETSLLASYLSGVDRAIISEVHFDPEKLAALILADKKSNPSHYAMLTMSEGAQMVGGKIVEYGQADAYGHKKLGGIGQITGDALKKITGEDTLYQQISYLMRSGAPDSLDLMVAVNYANTAIKLVKRGASNRMVALRNGTYTSVPVATIMQGLKRVDVEELYDVDQYRPKVRHVEGKPMFLY